VTVDYVVRHKRPVSIPIIGEDGLSLGAVVIPPDTFPPNTVIRVTKFDGPSPEIEETDHCGKHKKRKKLVSPMFDVTAYYEKRQHAPKFKKPIEIAQAIVIPDGVDIEDLCLASSTSGDDWKCEDRKHLKFTLINRTSDGDIYLVRQTVNHFTGFSTLLDITEYTDEPPPHCAVWGLLQWLSMAFIIAAVSTVIVVRIVYSIYLSFQAINSEAIMTLANEVEDMKLVGVNHFGGGDGGGLVVGGPKRPPVLIPEYQ